MKKIPFLILVLCLALGVAACEFEFTTANFSNLAMASEVDQQNKPVSKTTTFSTTSPVIYAAGTLNNAPSGTVIKSEWYYLEEDPAVFIDSAQLTAENTTTDFSFSLSVPDNGWPVGKYSVKLFIDGTEKSSLDFTVE